MNINEYFDRNKERLYKLLVHCKRNVRYYNENWKFDLPSYDMFSYDFFRKNIPILEKDKVRNNSAMFLDEGTSIDDLTIDTTSGTEGKPIVCYRSTKERINCANEIWKLRKTFVKDLKPSDKFARFYAFRNKESDIVCNEVLYKKNDILLPLFDLSEARLIDYWEKIVEFKPKWMHGPSTTIYNLALAVNKNNLTKYNIEFIELSGEYVQEEHADYIEKTFNCKLANQYGCREYWPIAYSDNSGKLKVTDNVFVETIDNEEIGQRELIITLLKNDSWPLVRYRICDLGELEYDLQNNVYLNLTRGRKADFFTMQGNKLFNAIIFSGLSRAICEIYGANVILQFQVTKIAENHLMIDVRVSDKCDKEKVIEDYKKSIEKVVGSDIKISIREVEYIKPDKNTGKTKDFIDKTI